VLKKCRPDWDITTPEMKAAWQQGQKELFYPYGKTYAQTIAEQEQKEVERLHYRGKVKVRRKKGTGEKWVRDEPGK